MVSVEAGPPDMDAIRSLIENHREVQPMEMPSVQVPPGEYGTGPWAPEDVGPDGPAGSVDPGTPGTDAGALGTGTGTPGGTGAGSYAPAETGAPGGRGADGASGVPETGPGAGGVAGRTV
ncbi:hypothetical protein E1286_26975 [Nonomuraea terrae]|uniref:Uncharacterized protein n=1 Tax=Nonomuraea terrae TaxID=2530383 RepID=A0A4R4YM13_9ACTN|nr:hypothetical protein [Nonomuraea terrae]TDD44522.1 hypothetical protein E1286_26975 [Nonomuraea terrae]